MARRSYRGNSVGTTLSVGVTNSGTSLTLTDASSFPTGTFPFVVTLDFGQAGEEKVLATSRSGNVLTGVTRGYDGTAATAHSAGATARHTLSATDLDEANAHVNATTGVHGLAGAVVGTTDVQTLTNKTLTAPAVGDFTNATHTHVSAATGGAIGFPADPRTKYALALTAPTSTTVTVAQAGTNTNNSGASAFAWNMGSVGGTYIVGYRPITDGYGTAAFIRSGIVDITATMNLVNVTGSSADLFVGMSSSVQPYANGAANGAFLIVDGTGAVKTLNRVASVSTYGTTTAAAATANTYRNYRITYPLAGGTATVYVDGVQVGTIASVPALTVAALVAFGSETTGTNGIVWSCSQLYITEG